MAGWNQTEINDVGRINILERTSELPRRLKQSTLIKMLTETLSIYERGSTLRKKKEATFSSS